MTSWTTVGLAGLLSVLTIGVTAAEASPSRVASGSVGGGSSYEVWRMNGAAQADSNFQLRIWRGTNRTTSRPTCTYGFPSSREALAFWRTISTAAGCPQQVIQTVQPAPIPAPVSSPSPNAARRRTIRITSIETVQPRDTSQPSSPPSSIMVERRVSSTSPQPQPTQPRPSQIDPPRPTSSPPPTLSQAQIGHEMLRLINAERQRVGARPLVLNGQLTTAAQRHAQDMAANRLTGHTGSDGSSVRSRVEDTGYSAWYFGENVAKGVTLERAMHFWMNSPGHRQNILSPNYTNVGIAHAMGNDGPYWVQVFGQPR